MRMLRIIGLGAALLAMAAALAACGEDEEGDDDGGAPAVTRPAGAASPAGARPTAAATTAADGADDGEGTVTITATEFKFTPDSVTIRGGTTTITFRNAGSATHTLTVYADEEFTEPIAGADSGRVTGGGEAEIELDLAGAGDRYFRCEVHPAQMQGEITVE